MSTMITYQLARSIASVLLFFLQRITTRHCATYVCPESPRVSGFVLATLSYGRPLPFASSSALSGEPSLPSVASRGQRKHDPHVSKYRHFNIRRTNRRDQG